jgi:hypothetical protein
MTSLDYSITLRIRHPSIDPQELSQQLGFRPQHAWRAGEQRLGETGEPTDGLYRETVWVGLLPQLHIDHLAGRRDPHAASTESVPLDLPAATLYLTAMKMKRAAAFWQNLAAQGGTVECLMQIRHDEHYQLDLSPTLIATLADLRIALSVEVELTRSRDVAAA